MERTFQFHPRLFNPLFWHFRKYLDDPKIRNIFVYGGSSAAKTYSIVQAFLVAQAEQKFNVMVFRKESTTIDDSVYNDFKSVSTTLKMRDAHRFIQKEIRVDNGSKVKFRGLDDPEKIKGLSSYKHLYMNDMSKMDESDLKETRRRLRGKKGQKIIADWNPISEDHWIKTNVIDKEFWYDLPLNVPEAPTKYSSLNPEDSFVKINKRGDTILICTTYLDNYYVCGHPSGKGGFVDEHALNEFERMKEVDYDDYLVYAKGKWGTVRTGTEFFDNFKRSQHVMPVVPRQDYAVHTWWDFNNLPYSTCLLVQVVREEDRMKVRFFDEVCLSPPTNTIDDVYDEVMYKYPWIRSMFYAIDPSGRSKGMRKSKDESDSYDDQIKLVFRSLLHNKSDMTPSAHPPKARRRKAMKELLSGLHGIDIEIDPKCKNLIQDYEKLLIATDGGYIKEKATNKQTGQVYEKLGHCADASIYGLCSLFSKKFFG